MVIMKARRPSPFSLVLLVALLAGIEAGLESDSNGRIDDRNNIMNQHLKRLQESLRWIRSPTTRAKFRPWGGKRALLGPASPPVGYQILDSLRYRNQPFETSVPSNCFESFQKRDKFRPWGGKRSVKEEDRGSSFDIRRDPGMPEEVDLDSSARTYSEGEVLEELSKYFPGFSPSGEEELVGAEDDQEESEDMQQGMKRSRFYPWAGKRARGFYPWAGKRSQVGVLTFGKPFPFNATDGAEPEEEAPGRSSSPVNIIPRYDSTETQTRRKRHTAESFASEASRTRLAKRSFGSSYGDNSKRYGVLSDLLKKFESTREASSPRAFHPWAGRKRSGGGERQVPSAQERSRMYAALTGLGQRSIPVHEKLQNWLENSSDWAEPKQATFYPFAAK